MSIAEKLADVISATGLSEQEFWELVSADHYAELVAQNRDHLLVFVKEQVDFGQLEAECGIYRQYAGERGQKATHTIGQLCRALLVKTLNGWSYVKTEQEIRSNELVRWFVGYSLKAQTMDQMTVWRFAEWMKKHQPRRYFDEVLRQIDAAFPEETKREQIGDTFALVSRAKEMSRTELLRQGAQKLLANLGQVNPTAKAEVLAGDDGVGLFGTVNEKPEWFLEKAERDALELRTARAAHDLLWRVDGLVSQLPESRELVVEGLRQAVSTLRKIVNDEFAITTDNAGKAVTVTHPTKPRKGLYRHGSTVDLDATFRIHGDSMHLGYNINVAATTNFIREINAVTGATPDSRGVAALIANQHEHLGVVPPKLIYDKAAGAPKIFAQVAAASNQQTQLVARLVDYAKNRETFGPLDFTLDAGIQLTCPAGQVSRDRTYSNSAEGWNFRFTAAQCADCPLFAHCRGPKGKVGTRRQVFINDHRYFQLDALAYTKTAAFEVDMKTRSNIERIIAGVTRYNDARHARGYGVDNADFQVKMAATAYNLKRWHKIVLDREKAQRYQPSTPIDWDDG